MRIAVIGTGHIGGRPEHRPVGPNGGNHGLMNKTLQGKHDNTHDPTAVNVPGPTREVI